MPRSHEDNWRALKWPEWKRRFGLGNPPAPYRRLWRQKYRACLRRLLQRDPENFQTFTQNRVTSDWDWY